MYFWLTCNWLISNYYRLHFFYWPGDSYNCYSTFKWILFFCCDFFFFVYDKYNEYPICKDSRDHWNIVGWRADGEASVPVKFEWWACGNLHGREERCSESLTAQKDSYVYHMRSISKKNISNYYWLLLSFLYCTVMTNSSVVCHSPENHSPKYFSFEFSEFIWPKK